ncbi:sensor histidine kinase [Nonomuraea rhizosphaerae]|uniref:sensor histidine kinase n=1 Tax=Nonomuraea rhizosphaerae TaxID=2665663 RepID=UPI0027E32802|nr:histidine kinase [Nonomuraea rhizosphaerae]
MTEYRWLLPSVLLGDGDERRPVRRSTRDWIVDVLMFLAACGITLLTLPDVENQPEPLLALEQVTGALACVAVWLRRRWPVGLALVTSVLSVYLSLVGGAAAVALFTVAVHRPFKISGPIVGLGLLTLLPYAWFKSETELGPLGELVVGSAIVLTVFAWGIVVRARRQLVWSLRQRADTAAEEAKRLERERIAREMHDVLAHRISILSLHAGALEFRPDAPAEEIARAAGAIRTSAHQALQDLREVIGVLRHSAPGGGPGGTAPDAAVPDRPQPTLADLPSLVEECRQAGMDVELALEARDTPEGLGRNAYRIVQEALTNARKHAGGAPVRVTVSGMPSGTQSGTPSGTQSGTPSGAGDEGRPAGGLAVEVRNPLLMRPSTRIPGAGTGLIGLTERAELAGGRLDHGATREGDFLVRAWLPWPAQAAGDGSGQVPGQTSREDA